jgi:type II secretory pathway predicted ATPase ExeA
MAFISLLWNHHLGRNDFLVFDKVKNLLPAVLERLRLLTNLEADEQATEHLTY